MWFLYLYWFFYTRSFAEGVTFSFFWDNFFPWRISDPRVVLGNFFPDSWASLCKTFGFSTPLFLFKLYLGRAEFCLAAKPWMTRISMPLEGCEPKVLSLVPSSFGINGPKFLVDDFHLQIWSTMPFGPSTRLAASTSDSCASGEKYR